jgi:hypothetical protein
MSQAEINKAFNLLQGFILLATVAGVFMSIGAARNLLDQNSRSIDDLKGITADLVKSQVLSASNDQQHEKMLDDIVERLNRLEQPR